MSELKNTSQSEVYRAAATLQIAHTQLQWARTSVFTVLNTASAAFVINKSQFLGQITMVKISFLLFVLLFNILLLFAAIKSDKYKNFCFNQLESIENNWIENKDIGVRLYSDIQRGNIEKTKISSFRIYVLISLIAVIVWGAAMADSLGVIKVPIVTIQ